MKLLLPYPLLSLAILAMWLLLNQSVSAGQLLLGTLIALSGGWSMQALDPAKAKLKRPLSWIVLACIVFADIVQSNIAVAKIILKPSSRKGAPGFMAVPLDLRHRYGLSILAIIITSTPGTIWVNFSPSSGMLLIHVLDLTDEQEWIDIIKNRYERRLREIFE